MTVNLRDLGGLPTRDGRVTRTGALFRSGRPEDWDVIAALGIRTVIDLRNEDEHTEDGPIPTLRLPLDGLEDREFWDVWWDGPQFGTPAYYAPHLARMPERTARVLEAIADAPPGGVLFHCQSGRDRTGQIALAVLHTVGVAPGTIAADYARSPLEDDGTAYLAETGTDAAALIAETVAALPPLVDDATAQRLRDRLLEG